MTKVLVTGASGFIGAHLVRALETRGHEVMGWDRVFFSDGKKLFDLGKDLHQLDTRGRALLYEVVDWADQVYHLAGNADVGAYDREPDLMAREWVMAAQVIGACLLDKKPLVVASSAYAGGCNTGYGRAKRGIEEMCGVAGSKDDSRISYGRIFNVYGPGQEKAVTYNRTVVLNLCRAFKKGDWALKHPSVKRDFIYVDDVVNMLLWSMQMTDQEGMCGQWDLCTDRMTSVLELGTMMARLMGHTEPLILPDKEEVQLGVYGGGSFLPPDVELTVSLEEGLRRTIAHMEETANA